MSILRRLIILVGLLLVACKAKPPLEPPPDYLASVPEGYGTPFDAAVVLTVKDRQLVLPSGKTCMPEEPACTAALNALRGQKLALEVPRTQIMADLSGPLAALSLALKDQASACLVVTDQKSRRCVAFWPFSGAQFSAWIDADQPAGKIRVIMRSDGLEVVADRGKVAGPDRYGPTLPSMGAKPDYQGLNAIMARLARSFPSEDIAGLAPSGILPVEQTAQVLAILHGPGGKRFSKTFLVYP